MIEFYYYLLFVLGGLLPMKVNEIACTKHLINTPHYHDIGFKNHWFCFYTSELDKFHKVIRTRVGKILGILG